MNKNLKISYILFFVFSAIVIAFRTLASFFGGVGLNFVAMIALVMVVLTFSTICKSAFFVGFNFVFVLTNCSPPVISFYIL